MGNKKSCREQVLEYHPKAIAKKVGKIYEVWSPDSYLGKGQNARCAWISASRNI